MDFDVDDRTTESLLRDELPSHLPRFKSSTINPDVHISFDEILEEIGEFGKFQIINYILICFPVMFASANNFTYLFVARQTEFRCSVPVCDSFESTIYQKEWLPNALPSITKEYYTPAECEMYAPMPNMMDLYNGTCSSNLFNQSILVPCKKWISKYNDEITIVNEWKMFCKDTWKLPFVGTVHFAGIVTGCGIFGFLADRFGRKLIFIFCIIFMSLSGVAQVFCRGYASFIILVFINAVGTAGVYPMAFIMGVESVGKQKRELTGVGLNYFNTLGEIMVGVIAWTFPNWIIIQLVFSGPPIIFIIYWWIIPESIRWLLVTRRTRKAATIIEKVAKINGVTLSETIKMSLRAVEAANKAKSLEHTKNDADHEIWPCVKEILSSCKMVIRFLTVLYIWLSGVFVFYGLSVNSLNMSGHKYLNFILTSAATIPGYTLAWTLIYKIGRKWTVSGTLFGCCFCSLVVIFISKNFNWLRILLYFGAKMFVSSSLMVCWIYTAELLPTVIRSGGVGTASTIARLAAMLAPFVPYIYPSIPYLPMVLFSTVAGLGAILVLVLPETKGIKLPETVEEAKSI
ncbi:solute carrier family 22 member 21-like [Chrysoperla carnea]|uniref:solute carrier family 22 member 21-like n=1 Tax=Chrysoperla carnea TaxID=189513 RepID=UPI001D0812F1|nr:solute carrier family 22 member 21-like [Chrysoperla carnea]